MNAINGQLSFGSASFSRLYPAAGHLAMPNAKAEKLRLASVCEQAISISQAVG